MLSDLTTAWRLPVARADAGPQQDHGSTCCKRPLKSPASRLALCRIAPAHPSVCYVKLGVSKKTGAPIWNPNKRTLIVRTPKQRTPIYGHSHLGPLWSQTSREHGQAIRWERSGRRARTLSNELLTWTPKVCKMIAQKLRKARKDLLFNTFGVQFRLEQDREELRLVGVLAGWISDQRASESGKSIRRQRCGLFMQSCYMSYVVLVSALARWLPQTVRPQENKEAQLDPTCMKGKAKVNGLGSPQA